MPTRTQPTTRRGPATDALDESWGVTTDVADPYPPLLTARTVTGAIAAATVAVLALAMLLLSPPYVVQSPGPTVDTIGDIVDEPLITITGAETYPTDGELLLTTVSTRGGPGYPVTTGQVLTGWLSSAIRVMPREAAYDPGQTKDEVSEESTMQMVSSQANASVAALTELGYEVPAELWVAGAVDGGASEGLLLAEDRLTWIEPEGAERTEITSFEALTEVLARTPADTMVTLGVVRDGQDEEVAIRTADDGEGGSILGVLLSPHAELPVDIDFAIENIGGPSGGLMLSLAIVDMLTPGSITGGKTIAGTGTTTIDGDIGPIGGIRQKLVGAREAGATWFLAPVENCGEVVGHVPDGLDVVAIDTLSDAVEALEAITAGETDGLPTCTAP